MLNEMEPEQFVERHRSLIAQMEIATHDSHKAEVREAARRLRDRWSDWQGEDSLHEMTFGEPWRPLERRHWPNGFDRGIAVWTDVGPAEIGAIVAIGAIIVVFIYWRIRRSRKGKNED
jgi:hypothetical protein